MYPGSGTRWTRWTCGSTTGRWMTSVSLTSGSCLVLMPASRAGAMPLGGDQHLPAFERGSQLLLPEGEEPVLVRSDLMDPDVVEARIDPFFHGLHVLLDIRTDGHALGRMLGRDRLRHGHEVGRPPQLLRDLAAQTLDRPELVSELPACRRGARPADLQLDVLRLARAAGTVVLRDELRIGAGRDEAVPDARREISRCRAGRGHVDRRRRAQRIETCVLGIEEPSVEAPLAAA